jgi:hypothetical protein
MPFFNSNLDGIAQFSLLDSLYEVVGWEYKHLDRLKFLLWRSFMLRVYKSKFSIQWVTHSSYFAFANKTHGAHATLPEVPTKMLLTFTTSASNTWWMQGCMIPPTNNDGN